MSVFDRSSDRPSNWLGICDNDVNFSSCCKGSTLSDHRSIISPDPCDEILSAKEEQTKKREMDVLLAQAMTGLTLEEREETQEVIHGVMEEIIEDTAEIDNALQDLNGHLSFIKRGSMYEMAESMDPKYVNSRAFRMMFLRANEYDPKASAEQMIKFFELKHHLFGVGKLTKDIRMEDLNEEDIACLKDGWVQLGGRDRSRRQIIVIVASLLEAAKSLQIAIRVLYFVLMRTFQQSDETQIRGNISIWYSAGQFSAKANGRYCEAYMAAQALPQKKAAIHFCVEALRHVVLSNSLQMVKVMHTKLRARLRLHFGSHTECQYQLLTYGISPQTLPLDGNGRLVLDRHLQWVHRCAMEDQFGRSVSQHEALESRVTPNETDVLFTGVKTTDHAGNQHFYLLLQEHSATYDSASDETKRQVVSTIIDEIHKSGGRFLQKHDKSSEIYWREVTFDEARQKVMQTFRNLRRRQNSVLKQKVGGMNAVLVEGEPSPNDVIFGRVAQRTPGTELLHRLIKDHFEEYESLNRGVKVRLVETIMQTLKDKGGRLLQPACEEGRWTEVPKDVARERICKYFRNHRRPYKQVK